MAGNGRKKSDRVNQNREQRLLELPALEIRQGTNRRIYSFALDGKQLPDFATVSRVHRDDGDELFGYQRAEVLSHIREIRRYLESQDPLLPNSIVVAFCDSVSFQAHMESDGDSVRAGTLTVPVDPEIPDSEKPAWIVDGQQRIAAIQEADVTEFPVSVVGFIAQDERDQRDQFILVNSTKPLPKGLVYELLPNTRTVLPDRLRRRRFPAYLLERLNFDADSALQGMIRTPTNPEGVIKDNSILRMLEYSLSDGILYWFRDPMTNEPQTDAMLSILSAYWGAVKDTFPDAWGLSPRKSRLMHGAGIASMGMLMDAIAESYRREGASALTLELFRSELSAVADACSWTSGFWEFRGEERRRWNQLQNVRRDIQLLSDHLLAEYKAHNWSQMAERASV